MSPSRQCSTQTSRSRIPELSSSARTSRREDSSPGISVLPGEANGFRHVGIRGRTRGSRRSEPQQVSQGHRVKRRVHLHIVIEVNENVPPFRFSHHWRSKPRGIAGVAPCTPCADTRCPLVEYFPAVTARVKCLVAVQPRLPRRTAFAGNSPSRHSFFGGNRPGKPSTIVSRSRPTSVRIPRRGCAAIRSQSSIPHYHA